MHSHGAISARAALDRRPSEWAPLFLLLIVVAGAAPVTSKGLISGLVGVVLLVSFAVWPAIANVQFFRRLGALTLVWAAAQVISDLWHGTQMFSGMALTGPLSVLMAAFLYWLHTVERVRVETLTIAWALGWGGLVWMTNRSLLAVDPWKYGLAPPATVLVLALLWRFRVSALVSALAMAGLAAVSLHYDSRLYAGLHFALFCGAFLFRRKARAPRRSSRRKRAAFLLAALVAAYLAYPKVAASGVLGQRAVTDQTLSAQNGASFLIAQRPEMPQAAYLVFTHPVLGIGSNAALDAPTSKAAIAFTQRLGVPSDVNTVEHLQGAQEGSRGYATHSGALDTAVHAGVLALGFWAFVFIAMWRGVTRRGRAGPHQMLLLLFVCGLQAWDALFSPLTATAYMQLGLVLFLLAAHQLDWREARDSVLTPAERDEGGGNATSDPSRFVDLELDVVAGRRLH